MINMQWLFLLKTVTWTKKSSNSKCLHLWVTTRQKQC